MLKLIAVVKMLGVARQLRPVVIAAALFVVALALAGCGGEEESVAFEAAAPASAMVEMVESDFSFSTEAMSGGAPSFDESRPVPVALAASASAPPSVPAPSSASAAVARSSSSAASTASDVTLPPLPAAQSSSADRGRIIIRTVNISLIASNVAGAIDRISTVARELGGWVVSSDRESTHTGFVSIRVPAELLDDALSFLRQTAVEVTAEASSSTDLTDEYVDNQSRLTSLRAAEAIVLVIMDRAESVQDALTVQRELVQIQS